MKFRYKEKYQPFSHDHLEDVQRIMTVCTERGIETDLHTCAFIWGDYSRRGGETWAELHNADDVVFDLVFQHAIYLNHYKGIDV